MFGRFIKLKCVRIHGISSDAIQSLKRLEKDVFFYLRNLPDIALLRFGCCFPTIKGLKTVLAKSKKCLCLLVKNRNDPSLGLKVNATLALNLPSICKSDVSIVDCPRIAKRLEKDVFFSLRNLPDIALLRFGCCFPTIKGLKTVLAKSKKCLCLLVKNRNDPSLGLKVNATLALNLPSICKSDVSIADCPRM
ncbi:hypothetical protein IFM89_039222 [Coptis chinensis]|uniref:Bifunctional inhibitor/plant lipid transfer protein/seed storage helical domain-containing protein n=1 Tax=Coptis chinensis TaxID=261450 RepID=A0A835IIX0_9MAGN|nr:hypothetical protein IFM89_039222 [Coptis chinensis]